MRKIVLAPYVMHQNLLKFYRKDNPFFDVKLMTREELIGQEYGQYKGDVIKYIMKKYAFSYDNCLALMSFIPLLNKNINGFLDIKNDLLNQGFINKNEYLNQSLKNSEIDVYGYSEKDIELKNILDKYGIKFEFIKNKKKNMDSQVTNYETVFNECFYTLNKVAELINNGVDINKIYIFAQNSQYNYFFDKFAPSFGYQVESSDEENYFSTSLASLFLTEYKESESYENAKQQLDTCEDEVVRNEFLSIIEECYDPDLPFELQFDYFVGELKSHKKAKAFHKNVVRIIKQPIFENNAHIFVVGFAQKEFPRSFKDNKIISDVQRREMGLNSSLEEIIINKDVFLDFFNSDNRFYFSYPDRSISEKYFPSPWIKELDLKEVKETFPVKVYSRDMVDFFYAKALDLEALYSEVSDDYFALAKVSKIPYGEYDNSYVRVNALNHEMRISHSYSKIKTYFECPFKYYLSNILKLDEFEGNFYTKTGNLAHKMFEKCFENDFEFNKEFEAEMIKQKYEPEEIPIVENLKNQIKKAVDAVLLHKKYMTNPHFLLEKQASFNLGKHSSVYGIIDKSIIVDNQYLVVVDYKTGSETFNPNYLEEGFSLQLPTYCLLAKNDDELKKYQIIGVFINNVINSKQSEDKKEDELIPSYLRLNGKIVADLDIIEKFDSTIDEDKASSQFIKSVSLKKGTTELKGKGVASKNEIDGYSEIALRKLLEADTNIRNNVFTINPLNIKNTEDACKNCSFRDICFVRPHQIKYVISEKDTDKEGEDDE